MTPLRSSLAALAAGVALAGAVAAVSPADGALAAPPGCAASGWTAYAPVSRAEFFGYLERCARDWPPKDWPPGAQPPSDHPEIQVIR